LMISRMRKFTAAVVPSALLAVSAGPAVAAINDQPGAGNPDVNASGKCPGGQNKDTSPGGLKKCPWSRTSATSFRRGAAHQRPFSIWPGGIGLPAGFVVLGRRASFSSAL